MILKFFFKQMSLQKQVNFLKKRGIMLGTRLKDGRRIYIYMLRDLFIEVLYKDDNVNEAAERLNMLDGLSSLNDYLEKEFKEGVSKGHPLYFLRHKKRREPESSS